MTCKIVKRSTFLKLSISGPVKIIYSRFHTLKKFDNVSYAKKSLGCHFTPKRNYFWIFRKRTKREIRTQDQPSETYQLIYRNSVDNYFFVAQYGMFFMSVTISLVAIFKSNRWANTDPPKLPGEEERPMVVENEILGFICGFLSVICVFYFLMARTPMRIYYYPQKQKYLMCFYGAVPNYVKKQYVFVGDINRVKEGVMPWHELMFQMKSGQKLMLFENFFRYPADLYIMLGWQKDPNVEGYEKLDDKVKKIN